METIYHDGAVAVLRGDCCEWTEDVDAIITDPPYSRRTHDGHSAIRSSDSATRREIEYACWGRDDVHRAVDAWHRICRGWIVVMTDHALAPSWSEELEEAGRYVFSPVPSVVWGSGVRLSGDGPSSIAVWTIVARPRSMEYARWGTLPGAYVGPRERMDVVGGKPVWLMRQLISDYSRAGDTVLDPCCGGGTTLVAAHELGRGAIGIDQDDARCRIAADRLSDCRQQTLPMSARRPRMLELPGSGDGEDDDADHR